MIQVQLAIRAVVALESIAGSLAAMVAPFLEALEIVEGETDSAKSIAESLAVMAMPFKGALADMDIESDSPTDGKEGHGHE